MPRGLAVPRTTNMPITPLQLHRYELRNKTRSLVGALMPLVLYRWVKAYVLPMFLMMIIDRDMRRYGYPTPIFYGLVYAISIIIPLIMLFPDLWVPSSILRMLRWNILDFDYLYSRTRKMFSPVPVTVTNLNKCCFNLS
jgi:hypothetical protein